MKRAVLDTLNEILSDLDDISLDLEFYYDHANADRVKKLRYRLMYVNEYLHRKHEVR